MFFFFYPNADKKHDGLRIRETELRRWRKRKAVEQITPVPLEKTRRERLDRWTRELEIFAFSNTHRVALGVSRQAA